MIQERVLKEVVAFLHSTYPDAAIGVSGSMANATFGADSDVDIVFQQKDVERNTLIAFSHRNVKVSVFTFSKEALLHNDRKFLLNFHNMPMTFIANIVVLYDEQNLISELKEYVESVVARRVLLKECLIRELKEEIALLLQQKPSSIIEEKRRCYGVVGKMLSVFFLRKHADRVIGKKEGHAPFATIMNEDGIFYVKLKECLPFHSDSYRNLDRFFRDYILTY